MILTVYKRKEKLSQWTLKKDFMQVNTVTLNFLLLFPSIIFPSILKQHPTSPYTVSLIQRMISTRTVGEIWTLCCFIINHLVVLKVLTILPRPNATLQVGPGSSSYRQQIGTSPTKPSRPGLATSGLGLSRFIWTIWLVSTSPKPKQVLLDLKKMLVENPN